MYVARDKDGELRLFDDKPIRCPWGGYWHCYGSDEDCGLTVDEVGFGGLRWDNDPVEVDIVGKKSQFVWHECKPGNMPEDLYPELVEVIPHNGNLSIGPFIGANGVGGYQICSRYCNKNGGRWTWSGLHPEAWAVIPEFKKL